MLDLSHIDQATARIDAAMQAQGFEPYALEWWHFSHPEQRSAATPLDVPVR